MKHRLLKYYALLSLLAMLCGSYTVEAATNGQQALSDAWTWRDFAVQLTKTDIFDTGTNSFGVKVVDDGSYTAVSADDETANFVVNAARFNDAQHGWVNCQFTVKVNGPVKIELGDCQYGNQSGTITDAAGNVTDIKANTTKVCWDPNAPNENVVVAYYGGKEPTTLVISYIGYCPFIAMTAIDPSEIPSEATVTFDIANAGAEGTAPKAQKVQLGDKLTIPANMSLYVEGKTLTAWADAESNQYKAGDEVTVSKDLVLTPVFTTNEVSLNDRTEAVTLNFIFRRDQGAPEVAFQNETGIWVAQANVNGKVIDVKADFDTNNGGKFANGNWNDWAQLNAGTKFKVPSCKGATISMEAYSNITTTTIDGQSDYTQGQTISYTIGGSAETVDVVIGDGSYYRYIKVVLPVVQGQQGGGKKFENAAGTIAWTVGDETNGTVSETIDGAISGASVSAGTDLKVEKANYFDTDMVKYTPTNSNAGNVEGVMIEYRVKAAKGVTFKPTKVDYAAVKVGTDGATFSWSYTVDGEESAITEIEPKANLLRNNGANSATAQLMHSENISANACETFTFRFYISKTANNKNICIGKVTISGICNGETVAVEMFSLATAAAPEEGGTVSVYPMADQYEAGSEVTLTATENFGYDFVNWTDASGAEVSREAKFKYTMTGNAQLTANFKQVNTYELALTVNGTNDYMVTVNPAPTIVDGKQMYEEGTVVQLLANQYDGLVTFTNWSDGETASDKLIAINENIQLTAFYAEADIIAGWDFYQAGGNGRKADFAAQDNDGDALNLVNTATGETQGWLDKSTLAAGGYESFKGAAVNWRTGDQNGDVGNWHWQTKVNAEAFTDINVQFQMLYNYNAYQTYNVEYSLDGENWTKTGSVSMNGTRVVGDYKGKLPAAANNQKDLYIRLIADKTSNVDGTASKNDGNTLSMFFITGTPKLVDDGKAPVLVSTVPADGATGASATGKIVLTFDERVKVLDNLAWAVLNNTSFLSENPDAGGATGLPPTVSGKTIIYEYKGLEYGSNYKVTIPGGTISDLTDNFVTEPIVINFTTMERPAIQKGTYDEVVGNVEELMAAIQKAESRADKNSRFRIFVKNGKYTIPLASTTKTVNGFEVPECITFLNSGNISFIGESRDGVVITNAIPATETFTGQWGEASKYEGIGQSDVFQIRGSGYYWQDLTVSTGIEDNRGRDIAIHDRGTKNIYKNTCLHGYQDTWVSNNDNGLYYFEGGVIRGRTDYICGKGDIYFNGVEFRQIKGGYLAVPSKPAKIGWVLKDCVINGEGSGVDGNYTLGRPWGSGTPVAVYIDTKMNVVPSAIGWNEMSGGWPARFAEFNSMTSTGSVIDLSGRKKEFGNDGDKHANNPVLTAEEALQYSDMHAMYGEWDPTLATEQAPAPKNVIVDATASKLTWDNSDYAFCWAVVKNGKVVGFTTEPVYTIDDTTAIWAVRAANEMGGLGEATLATTGTSGIKTIEQKVVNNNIYNMQGIRIEKIRKGLYIRDGKKIVK